MDIKNNNNYQWKQVILTFTIFGILMVNCSRKKNIEKSNIIESQITIIKPSFEFIQPNISTIIDTVKFVKLELSEKSIIGNINKVVIYNDLIYILDNQTYSIFVFNLEGKFIFKISKVGNGPGEYKRLDFFDIDNKNDQIVLTDLLGYWILRYDLIGNYISRKKIPFWLEGVAPVSEKGYIVYANYRDNKRIFEQEYNILYLDSTMKITKAYFPYNSSDFYNPRILFSTPQYGSFYTYNKKRYFFSPYKTQVYQVADEGLIPKYSFDFDGKNFNEEYLDQKTRLKDYMDFGDFYKLGNILENDNFVIFSFYEESTPIGHFGYYSKNSGTTICGAGFTMGENDFFHGSNIATYGSWIVAVIQPEDLLSWENDIDDHKTSPENNYIKLKKNIADHVTLEDNPILMFYKLKSF